MMTSIDGTKLGALAVENQEGFRNNEFQVNVAFKNINLAR